VFETVFAKHWSGIEMQTTYHRRRTGDTTTALPFRLRQPDLSGTLQDVDLTDKTVQFKMVNAASGELKVPPTSTGIAVDSGTGGTGTFDFSAAHVNEPGVFWGSFVVEFSAETETFPQACDALQILIDSDYKTAEEAFSEARRKNPVYRSDVADILGLPTDLVVGDSYTTELSRELQLKFRNSAGTPITSIGSLSFTDGSFSAEVTLSSGNNLSLIKTTGAWITAAESYLRVEFEKNETRKAAVGPGVLQVVFRWTGQEVLVARSPFEWVEKL
jgi:hypothetical protein